MLYYLLLSRSLPASTLLLPSSTSYIPPRPSHLTHRHYHPQTPYLPPSTSISSAKVTTILSTLITFTAILQTLHTFNATFHTFRGHIFPTVVSALITRCVAPSQFPRPPFRHSFHPSVCLAKNHVMRFPFSGLSSDSPAWNVGLQRGSWEQEWLFGEMYERIRRLLDTGHFP